MSSENELFAREATDVSLQIEAYRRGVSLSLWGEHETHHQLFV